MSLRMATWERAPIVGMVSGFHTSGESVSEWWYGGGGGWGMLGVIS